MFRRLARGLIEAFRIVAPHAIVTSVGYTVVLNVIPLAGEGQWGTVILYLTAAGLFYGLGTYVFVAAIKWAFMGRYRQRCRTLKELARRGLRCRRPSPARTGAAAACV